MDEQIFIQSLLVFIKTNDSKQLNVLVNGLTIFRIKDKYYCQDIFGNGYMLLSDNTLYGKFNSSMT
jgi:hypothetical protein